MKRTVHDDGGYFGEDGQEAECRIELNLRHRLVAELGVGEVVGIFKLELI
jgi:hypothetical protein